jgi:Zn-dependent protease
MFGSDMLSALQGLVLIVPGFLLAITVHEFAHGYVALQFGDPTAQRAGRLTFNPLSHLDPFGSLFLVLSAISGFGIGWAKPVPVDARNLRKPLSDMMWISLGGPVANLITAIALAFLLRGAFSALTGTVPSPSAAAILQPALGMLQYAIRINIVLAVFNLIPIPPLDGSKILQGLLPFRQAAALERIEPYGFMIMLALLVSGAISYIIVPPIRFIEGILLSGLA